MEKVTQNFELGNRNFEFRNPLGCIGAKIQETERSIKDIGNSWPYHTSPNIFQDLIFH